jgi:hypothetical protein
MQVQSHLTLVYQVYPGGVNLYARFFYEILGNAFIFYQRGVK